MVALTLALLTEVSRAADPVPPPGDVVVRTELPLKTPRSRDPVLGGSREKVFFQVWIPAGVKTVRGAICNPFSKDEAVSKHWQAACRHWRFAYLQTDFDGVKQDDFSLLPTALTDLAKQSGHPEIEHMPFCWTGMSRGGGMSMQLSELMPERHRQRARVPRSRSRQRVDASHSGADDLRRTRRFTDGTTARQIAGGAKAGRALEHRRPMES